MDKQDYLNKAKDLLVDMNIYETTSWDPTNRLKTNSYQPFGTL